MSDRGGGAADDDVQSALRYVIDNYGAQSLASETVLGNVLSDLLPDSPRESSLLLLAARADVAGVLGQHLGQQMDPDTAVRLTASSMAESSPVAPEACLWVTGEIARALGHPVAVGGPVAPLSQPTVPATTPANSPPPLAPPGAPGATGAPTSAAPGSWPPPSDPSAPPPASWPPPGAGAPAWGPQHQPPSDPSGPWGSQPVPPQTGAWGPQAGNVPAGTPPTAPTGKQRGGGFKAAVAGGAIVALVIVYVVVAAAAKLPPLSTSSTPTTHATTPTPAPTTPTTSGGPIPQVQQLSLPQLMPYSNQVVPAGYDVSSCTDTPSFSGLSFTGLSDNLTCDSLPNYPGWSLYGFKFGSLADYQAGLKTYNSSNGLGFDPASAQSQCPASAATDEGLQGWHSDSYPSIPGQQFIECLQTFNTQNQAQSTYVWTVPSEHAFFEIDAAPGVAFSAVDQWWTQYGVPAAP